MYVERLLQINMVALAALSTLLLGMGQRSVVLPMLVIVAGATSLWLTDRTGRFRLNRPVTNAAAAVALLLTLWELSRFRGILQVLSVANLLVYLQIIFFFQKKEVRTYRQLGLLSLLQVVSATALNQGLWFGLLLVVYLAAGLSALALLLLHEELSRSRGTPEGAEPAGLFDRRWPLAGCLPVFRGETSGGTGRCGVQREFWGRLARIGAGTLALTMLLFFAVPRLGANAWRGAVIVPRQTVGFNPQVQLGELGLVIEDPEEVMRVQLVHHETGETFQATGPLYLRGAVLTHYRQKRWSHYGPPSERRYERLKTAALPRDAKTVWQRITVEPLDREELFCVWPFFNCRPEQDLLLDVRRQRLLRPAEYMTTRFSFELGTTAFEDEMPSAITPADDTVSVQYLLDVGPETGPGSLAGLVALADRWVAESKLGLRDRYRIALYLDRQLRDSGHFTYSLKRPPRNPRLDPLEDFVTEHRQGHCEYFASALVLMLRSQGIPARLVVGYKCSEYNPLGQFYQVRQLHAHTWVEAFLTPEYLPRDVLADDPAHSWDRGAWLRLDPTPSAPGGDPLANYPVLAQFGRALDWLDFLWANYIMEMDRPRQQQAIYEPVRGWLQRTVTRLADQRWWRAVLARAARAMDIRTWGTAGWLACVAVVTLVAGALAGVVARLVGWRMPSRWVAPLASGKPTGPDSTRLGIAFYRRLEQFLARLGQVRRRSQTQREFAVESGRRLAELTGRPALGEAPCRVVEAFYQVRFGHQPLDSTQTQAVEQVLADLEQAVVKP